MAPHTKHSIRRQTGFTLIEILIVVSVILIATALAVPMMGNGNVAKLRAAASLLVADLEFAQAESMTHGGSPRVLVFTQASNSYSIATAATPGTPLTNAIDKQPYSVTFGMGRAGSLSGVTIQSYSLNGDNKVGFGLYGQLDQTSNATITLACGGARVTITLDATTGTAAVGPIQ